ncbi:MAG: hypothetical protein HY401_02360 [Elusimicrobia bacterium]|nr:hypothetical protein [Elusimicrobiota bacterium]
MVSKKVQDVQEGQKVQKASRMFFLNLLNILNLLTLSAHASYLDSRHWGEPGHFWSASAVDYKSGLFDQPFLSDQNNWHWRLEAPLVFERESVLGARSKEPVVRESTNNFLSFPAVEFKPFSARALWIKLRASGIIEEKFSQQRALYAAGQPAGQYRWQDSRKMPIVRYELKFFVTPKTAANLSFNHIRGERNLELDRYDADGSSAWTLREKAKFEGWATGVDFYQRIARGWVWALGFSAPADLRAGHHQLVYQSTQSALAQGELLLPSRFRLPPVLRTGFIFSQAQRKFWAEAHWIYFSQSRADGRPAGEAGGGFLWDTGLFQRNFLGNASIEFPNYRDVLGLDFGFENTVAERWRLFLTSRFWTHYADARVLTPAFSLGMELNVTKSLRLGAGGTLERRDYFGDGLFWPKDQRLDETSFKMILNLAYRI